MKIGKGLIALIIIGIIAVILLGSLWGQFGALTTLENRVEAKHTANKSEYDNMWKSFKETANVTKKQANEIKTAYMDLISGRYQDENLLFKMVKEDNPKMDTTLYSKLMDNITAGRKTFNNVQKQLIDVAQEYNNYLDLHPWWKLFGKKNIDPNKLIVTSERTDNAFGTGKDEEIEID